MVKHIFAENILLSIYPEKGKSLLSTIKDLREEAALQSILLRLVEHFVSLRELEAIVLLYGGDIQYSVQPFNALEVCTAVLGTLV